MKAARALRYARVKSGLTQRELGQRAGVPQSTIGRIESGAVDPRVGTLSRLLRHCGYDLEVEPALGVGVDRTLLHSELRLVPADRLRRAVQAAHFIQQFRKSAVGPSRETV